MKISHEEWSFVEPTLHESREVTSDNSKDIKKAYPMLKANPKFGNMSSGEMWDYLLTPENLEKSKKFSTVFTYMSNTLTSEGAYYLADLSGYKGDITEFISPTHYIEFVKLGYSLSDTYVRPHGGMSAIIDKLHEEVQNYGGRIFLNDRVMFISKRRSKYYLRTANHKVVAKKLVVATPPKPFYNIKGTVASKIKESAQFQSIQPIPAFKGHFLLLTDLSLSLSKSLIPRPVPVSAIWTLYHNKIYVNISMPISSGAALYENPWWEKVKIGNLEVKAGQKFISQDNCIGISMAHR